jgi:hypothetical protein
MVVRPVRRPEGSARAHVDDGLKRGTARGDSATNAAAHSIAASSSTAITVKGGRMGANDSGFYKTLRRKRATGPETTVTCRGPWGCSWQGDSEAGSGRALPVCGRARLVCGAAGMGFKKLVLK